MRNLRFAALYYAFNSCICYLSSYCASTLLITQCFIMHSTSNISTDKPQVNFPRSFHSKLLKNRNVPHSFLNFSWLGILWLCYSNPRYKSLLSKFSFKKKVEFPLVSNTFIQPIHIGNRWLLIKCSTLRTKLRKRNDRESERRKLAYLTGRFVIKLLCEKKEIWLDSLQDAEVHSFGRLIVSHNPR